MPIIAPVGNSSSNLSTSGIKGVVEVDVTDTVGCATDLLTGGVVYILEGVTSAITVINGVHPCTFVS